MSQNTVGKPGIASFLPSPPSAKTMAGIGIALVVISSLGAYLYFCGPHLPASSMDWKFAAGGVILTGSVTVVAFIVLRRSGTEKTEAKEPGKGTTIIALDDATSTTGKSDVEEKSKSNSEHKTAESAEKGKTIETAQDAQEISAEGIQAMERKISSDKPEDYAEIKQFLTHPKNVETTFRKTVHDAWRHVPLVGDELAIRLIEDFAANEEWLKAMIKGILPDKSDFNDLSRDRSVQRLRDLIEDTRREQTQQAFSTFCAILKQDQACLVEILESNSWDLHRPLLRILLNLFDFSKEPLLGILLHTNYTSSLLTHFSPDAVRLFLEELATLNEPAAAQIILYLRGKGRLNEIFKTSNDGISRLHPLPDNLVQYLKDDEKEIFAPPKLWQPKM